MNSRSGPSGSSGAGGRRPGGPRNTKPDGSRSAKSGPKSGNPKSGNPKSGDPKSGDPRQRTAKGGARGGSDAPKGQAPRPSGGRSRQGRAGGSGARRSGPSGAPRRQTPRGLGGDQIEGRHAVRELLLAGKRRVREIFLIDDLDPADILEDIAELAFEANVAVRQVSRRHFATEALTESHQGVLARADEIAEVALDDMATARHAFLLVLDGITDPGNLGAILRTAECAGVTGVVLPRHRAVQITPTVTKTAAGAVEHLDMALVGGIPSALGRLSELGVTTIGLEAGSPVSLFDLPTAADERVALVLGAEGVGLSRLTRERVDVLASLPLAGNLNSLNVAMAGAVACFEVLRRREARGGTQTPS
jgi:23S rRNA (guanosine2251-2'-O)-methyltransferase